MKLNCSARSETPPPSGGGGGGDAAAILVLFFVLGLVCFVIVCWRVRGGYLVCGVEAWGKVAGVDGPALLLDQSQTVLAFEALVKLAAPALEILVLLALLRGVEIPVEPVALFHALAGADFLHVFAQIAMRCDCDHQ